MKKIFSSRIGNKEVPLCERKRHTNRGVSSTTSAAISRRGGGTYFRQGGGYLPWMGGGVPTLDGGTPPPVLTWPGGGVPTLDGGRGTYLGWGYPSPCPDLARGRGTYLGWGRGTYLAQGRYPLSPPRCGQTENITSHLILRTRSVKSV